MSGKTTPRRTLRYATVGDMPEGMRRLHEKSAAATVAAHATEGPKAPRVYRPVAPAGSPNDASATGKVARGRPRHVAGEMNKTEAAYAEYLVQLQREGEVLWHRFESVKLKLADRTHLTVDFFVMTKNGDLEAHEVKGFWEEDARVKVKVAAAMYPFRFLAVQRAPGGGWKTEVFS